MTIGTSFIAIREKGRLSVCAVDWLWGMPIFQAETKKEKCRIRRELKRIFKTWHDDDKFEKKFIVKNEKEMVKKFCGDTYGIIEKDGIYLGLDKLKRKKDKAYLD